MNTKQNNSRKTDFYITIIRYTVKYLGLTILALFMKRKKKHYQTISDQFFIRLWKQFKSLSKEHVSNIYKLRNITEDNWDSSWIEYETKVDWCNCVHLKDRESAIELQKRVCLNQWNNSKAFRANWLFPNKFAKTAFSDKFRGNDLALKTVLFIFSGKFFFLLPKRNND